MKPESSESSTILVVDDQLNNLKLLTTYMKQQGFELMVAQNGICSRAMGEIPLQFSAEHS